jgi:hypothetical protein
MLLKYFSVCPRQVFLADGLGALLSTILLFVVASFVSVFGMPKNVLYTLMVVPIVFAAYSLSIYLINPKKWKSFLAPVAIANILYCCLTLMLVFYYFDRLSVLGVACFFIEILVIISLAVFELRLCFNQAVQ